VSPLFFFYLPFLSSTVKIRFSPSFLPLGIRPSHTAIRVHWSAIGVARRAGRVDNGIMLSSKRLMSSRLDLTAPTAYQGPRTLIKEGPVTKSKSGRKLTMVLCNDIIVLVESRNLYRMVSPVSLLPKLFTPSFPIFPLVLSFTRLY
jgi:hypothetical protein